MDNNKLGWVTSVLANGSWITLLENGEKILTIIVAVFGILSALISMSYTIYKWYKGVTHEDSDGGEKITLKEITKAVDSTKDTIDKVKEEIENANKNK